VRGRLTWSSVPTEAGSTAQVWRLPEQLGLTAELERVRQFLAEWTAVCDPEVRPMVRRQLAARAKYYRPVTVFACHRAVTGGPPPTEVVRSAAAVEIVHNVSLIIDDILDRSRYRRGELSLHCRFGSLPALMTAGYMTSGASAVVAEDPLSVRLLAELMQRLGAAECLQWRLRRQPLGVEDWRRIAGEDTGTMFEVCAHLGTRDDRLRRFGLLLGILYHGCDDVADVRGTAALGGGSEKDIVDGILTLPAAIAIRDPATAVLFRRGGAEVADALAERMLESVPEAEEVLDRIGREAEAEAVGVPRPESLLQLIDYTRALSNA
jgi:geranylgeranyl pyrophosphate synthase